jgi:hypothetical protein
MPWVGGRYEAEEIITCIDCGGRAHLLTPPPGPDDLPVQPGDIVVYRCEDCLDRWDLEVPEDEAADDDRW